jgi:hypothetical protein
MTEPKRVVVHCDQCKSPLYTLRAPDDGGFPVETTDPRTDGKGPPVVLRYSHAGRDSLHVFCNGHCAALHVQARPGPVFPLRIEIQQRMQYVFRNAIEAADWLQRTSPRELTGGIPINNLSQWL